MSTGSHTLLKAQEDHFLSQSRQLIYDGKRSGEGYFSKDGRFLIFQAEREADNPFYQMYILDFETGDIDRVSPGHGKTTCGYFNWSKPDQVLFASSHHDPEARNQQQAELDFRASGKQRRYAWDYEPQMDIYAFTKDGQELQNLTNTLGYDAEGSYSPDGQWIAFTSNRHAYADPVTDETKKQLSLDPSFYNEIYLMRADGSDLKRLTTHDGYDGGPFFSPDGQSIIWRRFNTKGDQADVYTMKIDGSDVQQITDFKCMSWAPFYHPSGDYVLFASNKLGFSNFELYMVDALGERMPVQITATDGFDGLPVFSPDGTKLVWTSNRTSNGKSQLFLAKWNDAAARQALAESPLRRTVQQTDSNITENDLRKHIQYLASDELGGRMTGTLGAKMAAQYIEQAFRQHGLKPLAEHDYTLPFEFSAEIEVDAAKTKLSHNDKMAEIREEFTPFLFSDNGSVEASTVFAGYGLTLPGSEGYSSYTNLDVKGKTVLVIEEIPSTGDKELDRQLDRYGAVRYRSMLAREAGASAIVMIGKKRLQRPDALAASAGILALRVTPEVATLWMKAEGKDYAVIAKDLASFNPHLNTQFEFSHPLKIAVQLKREKKQGKNLIAVLPASQPSESYIVIGAHYDHIGMGRIGSLVADNKLDQIHNGADDNASGTALVMELAEYLPTKYKEDPDLFDHHIIFALWSGEELGLIGSEAFCDALPIDPQQIKAYLNFDMVGRMKENKLVLQGIGSAMEWKKIIERKNIVHGFSLALQEDPYLPTDATSFYKKDIPILSFFTGLHEDYHRPSDDSDKINYEDLARITKFSSGVLMELLSKDLTFQKVEMSQSQQNMRSFSVYLGTIPDYAAEVVGVKLSGVRPGAPSEQAGLKAGDIIIELAGKEIRNIYDYTYILGDLVVGKKEKIKINRDGKELLLEIIPGKK